MDLKTAEAPEPRRRLDWRRTRSLRSRLILLAIAIALPLILFAGFMVVRSYEFERARLEEHSRELARAFTLAVDRELKSSMMAVETLATAIPLQTGGLAGFRLQAELFLARQPAGSAIVLLDENGRRLLDSRWPAGEPLPASADPDSARQVFRTGKTWISDLFISAIDGQPRISIDVPVESSGQVAYDLSMRIPLDALAALIGDQRLPEGWITSIIDRNGTIVARSRDPHRFVGNPVMPELLETMRRTDRGIVAMDTPEGVPALTIFSPLPTADGWKTTIRIPRDSFEAPLEHSLWMTAGGGLGLLAVAALLAMIMADRIARPILSLKRAAFALARGREPARPPGGIREVEAVGLALQRAGTLLRAEAAARDRTEQALRRSEALLHRAQILAKLGHWIRTPEIGMPDAGDSALGDRSEYSPAGAAIFGAVPADLAITSAAYLDRFVHPDDREQVRLSLQAFMADDRTEHEQTYRIIRSDGSIRIIHEVAEKILRGDGALDHTMGTVQDVTELKRAEERLRESERRERARASELTALLEAVPAVVFVAHDPDCRVITGSRASYELLRLPPGSNLSKSASGSETAHFKVLKDGVELLPPTLPVQRAARGETVRGYEEEILFADGTSRHLYGDAIPLRDEQGTVTGAIGSFLDISERKRGEEQQKLLTAELSHRVKNTLAVVQSIATQTLRHTPSPEIFNRAFMGRLRALAAAHSLLTRTQWQSARLEDVVWQALRAHAVGDRTILIEGPETQLAPKQTLGLSIVLHELATNAAKYGALSVPAGRIAIRWTTKIVQGGMRLRLDWSEADGPSLQPPAAEGFGTLLIRRTVTYDLDGAVELRYEPTGLRCEIGFSLLDESRLGWPTTPLSGDHPSD